MIIYIDTDYKCYTESAEDRTAVESAFFDGKCKTFIEGYRFVPEGETWTREDGVVFTGEMIAPWKDYSALAAAQAGYEEAAAELHDRQEALNLLGVDANG